MAIFRKGVKVPLHDDFLFNKDIRVGVGKKRVQGLLRKLDIIDDGKGRKEFEKDARGEVQMIRTAVAQAEGFTVPANFKMVFNPPQGVVQPVYDRTKREPPPEEDGRPKGDWIRRPGMRDGHVRGGGLDWKTHKMNF